MKRLILTLAAVATIGGSMAAAVPAMAQGWRDNDRWDNDGRRDGRWDGRRDRDGRWDRDRGDRWDRDGRWDNDRRWGGGRWDSRRHNGYWYNNRWSYGPPRADYYGRPGFRLGYSSWRRGAYLPPYYRGYVVNDYYRYRLRRPPYGYHWVRVGPDYPLVAIGTGLIFDIIGGRY